MGEIKKGFASVTKSIAKGGGTFIKTTKLGFELANEEGHLKNLYTQIGKKVHEIYSYGGSLGEFFDIKYQEVLAQSQKINDIKKAMDLAKGVKTCPKCFAASPRASVFCSKCGGDIRDISEDKFEPLANGYKDIREEGQMAQSINANGHVQDNFEVMQEGFTQERPGQDGEANVAIDKGEPCRACGAFNDALDKFCLACGRIL